jgi:type I restriction enzyme S subunit
MARYEADCAAAKLRGQKTPKLEWTDENPDFSGYDLQDLPDNWEWSHISKFGFVKGGKRLPKGEMLVEENTGHPYLRVRDLKDGTVDRSQILHVPKRVFPRIKNYTIQHGDVYLTIVGSIGLAGTIPIELNGASLTENAAKIVQPLGFVPEFLALWLRSPQSQQIIQQNVHSGGQGKLALFRIEQLPVPVAPLPEQQEIVRRVEKLFKLADQIEKRFAEARKRVESIPQSVLAKAFRGELVPTEYELAQAEGRSFESAEQLLERIQKNGQAKAVKAKK